MMRFLRIIFTDYCNVRKTSVCFTIRKLTDWIQANEAVSSHKLNMNPTIKSTIKLPCRNLLRNSINLWESRKRLRSWKHLKLGWKKEFRLLLWQIICEIQ